MNNIRKFWHFISAPPKHYDLAARELENARKSFLEHKTHSEYYSTLCSFEEQRIKRLEIYLGLSDPE